MAELLTEAFGSILLFPQQFSDHKINKRQNGSQSNTDPLLLGHPVHCICTFYRNSGIEAPPEIEPML